MKRGALIRAALVARIKAQERFVKELRRRGAPHWVDKAKLEGMQLLLATYDEAVVYKPKPGGKRGQIVAPDDHAAGGTPED